VLAAHDRPADQRGRAGCETADQTPGWHSGSVAAPS
jgi:hypothetical protein